jgi:ubiquinone/menaquinone biosynthesis C-methylase UbiE
MMSEDLRKHWDQQASVYASDEGVHRFKKFLELYEANCWQHIEPFIPPVDGAKILEVGCGTGRWVYRLAPMGYQITLSDLSPEMIRFARERVEELGLLQRIDGFHVLDITDLNSLDDCNFDLVLALGGPLGLCEDIRKGVAELCRVAKVGGYIICDVANRFRTGLVLVRSGTPEQIIHLLTSGEYERPDGLKDHRFDYKELKVFFNEVGCELESIAGICPFFDFLPDKESVDVLKNGRMYKAMIEVSKRYSEEPAIVGISGRLLCVALRKD